MTNPKTIDDVVQWFDDTHDPTVLRDLVERMLSAPNPLDGGVVTPAQAWKWIVDFDLLYRDGQLGWVDRDGKLLTTAHAAHERLLYWLGMSARDAEDAGWVRVCQHGWQCQYRLTARQKATLGRLNIPVDKEAERMKPVWMPAEEDAPLEMGRPLK